MRRDALVYRIVMIALLLTLPTQESVPQSYSETWENLSTSFQTALQVHERTLTQLSQKLETSQNDLRQSQDSLKLLSEQLKTFKVYANQLGDRLQSSNEDLAQAYFRIHVLRLWLYISIGLAILATTTAAILFVKRS